METLKVGDTLVFTTEIETFNYKVDKGTCGYFLQKDDIENAAILKLVGVDTVDDDDKYGYCSKIVGHECENYGGNFPELETLKDLTKVVESFFPFCESVTLNGEELISTKPTKSAVKATDDVEIFTPILRDLSRIRISLD